jgi:hypothetical protein
MKENQLDELAKGMARSVTRRQALKKFGVGLAGMTLAGFGLANIANAGKKPKPCLPSFYECREPSDCCSGLCLYASQKPTRRGFCY